MVPVLYLVIPCYNEEEVLPETSKLFLNKIKTLASAGKISDASCILVSQQRPPERSHRGTHGSSQILRCRYLAGLRRPG